MLIQKTDVMDVSTIIVTYNRKNELIRCINAVLAQSVKPANIVVVNNASTDGTKEIVSKLFPDIILINLSENSGGAGGFCTGLEYAHKELNSSYFWLMDDDGYPEKNCLEILLKSVDSHDYVMPVSLNIENPLELSWPTRMRNGKKTVLHTELKKSWGEIMDYVTPFNGVLLSKKCVDKVGYINKDFFIWGDDYEHYYRCLKNSIRPVTLLNATFFHPAQKIHLVKICLGLFKIPYVPSRLRMFCLVRNWTYIYRHYGQFYKIPIKYFMYWWLFHITLKNESDYWGLYKKAVKDGFKEDFTRHFLYR